MGRILPNFCIVLDFYSIARFKACLGPGCTFGKILVVLHFDVYTFNLAINMIVRCCCSACILNNIPDNFFPFHSKAT